MRRTLAVLFWIFVGALAAGGSVGYFFFQANTDRARLVADADAARAELAKTKAAQDALTKEANAKIADANALVASAANRLKLAEADRALRARAVTLDKPPAAALKSWSESASVSLGVSFRLPPGFKAIDTDAAFTVQNAPKSFTTPVEQFLSLRPYQLISETELLTSLKNPEPVTYQVGGQLLDGTRGRLSSLDGDVFVLRLLDSHGSSTHLLWARSSSLLPTSQLLQLLGTLTVR
jgi:hypothetical protein